MFLAQVILQTISIVSQPTEATVGQFGKARFVIQRSQSHGRTDRRNKRVTPPSSGTYMIKVCRIPVTKKSDRAHIAPAHSYCSGIVRRSQGRDTPYGPQRRSDDAPSRDVRLRLLLAVQSLPCARWLRCSQSAAAITNRRWRKDFEHSHTYRIQKRTKERTKIAKPQ
jgi:hypothetical protein